MKNNYSVKAIENLNMVDINHCWNIIEQTKAWYKLSKIIRHAEKVFEYDSGKGSNSPLYRVKQKKLT